MLNVDAFICAELVGAHLLGLGLVFTNFAVVAVGKCTFYELVLKGLVYVYLFSIEIWK